MKTLQNYIYIIIGSSFISLIFYNRVIVTRLPKELYIFTPNLNILLCLIIFAGVCLSFNIIYFSLKILLNIKIKDNFATKYFFKINHIIEESLKNVYNLIGFFSPNMYNYISSFCWFFYEHMKDKREDLFAILCYIIRIFIVFVFLYDVFFLFELKYFYKVLILMIIPIIKNIIFYILKDFITNLDLITPALQIEIIAEDHHIFSPTKGYEHIDLNYYIQEFIRCIKVRGYLEEYRVYGEYYLFRVSLFIYSLYLIGWLYIIYINYILFW